MGSEDLQTCLTTTLPQAMEGLQQSHRNIDQIAQYCKNAYASEQDQNGVFLKTQNYVKDALSNVAYHIHAVSLHITNFLQLQANEIDKISLQIQAVSDRTKSAHDNIGQFAFRSQDSVRAYQRQPKLRKLDESQLPENARPVGRYTRQAINLKALDNVGIDLTGHKGTDGFTSALTAPPSMQAPPVSPAPSQASMGAFAPPQAPVASMRPPPPAMYVPPPPPMANLPPPRNLMMGTGFGAPPPPPPVDFEVPMDLPPPPSFDDMAPPPPPPRDY